MMENEKEFYDQVGQKIKALREKAEYKQEDFANLIGLSRASIVNIEKGRQNPSFYLIWRLSKIFNISMGYFIGENELLNYSNTTELSDIFESKISQIANKELAKSPESINKFRNFVIESLCS